MTAPAPRYGPHDAICVLHAAGQRVAARWEGWYTLNGKRITAAHLNEAAASLAGSRRFTPVREPVFPARQDTRRAA